jgi:SAM-dependent methyltransferase
MGITWPRHWLTQYLRRYTPVPRPQPPTPSPAAERTPGGRPAPTHGRFLSDQPQRREAFLAGAHQYVSNLDAGSFAYLYMKPFDPTPGNAYFYTELYQVLNILGAMNLPPRARVLEVGSGPGWVTEILIMLGFEVDAIEPSDRMIAIARERLTSCQQHHRLQPPRVTFHCQTLEDCELPDGRCDAVLFHESLHHIIDEHQGLAQCYRILKPGGILGVCGEGAWHPDKRALQEFLEAEMARFGTLENPYTAEYLVFLLREHGFTQVTRYHGINGLFPEAMGHRPIKELAQFSAADYNTLTAVKPCGARDSAPDTADPRAQSGARIEVLQARVDSPAKKAYVKVRLVNTGKTLWLRERRPPLGFVTVSLYQGKPGGPGFREAHPRHPLPQAVAPGQTLTLETTYSLPEDYQRAPWYLDLVNEHYYWFSSRGTVPAEVELH